MSESCSRSFIGSSSSLLLGSVASDSCRLVAGASASMEDVRWISRGGVTSREGVRCVRSKGESV